MENKPASLLVVPLEKHLAGFKYLGVVDQARREGGAEGVIARGPGDTEGPWVQNCQDRMQNYGLRTPLVYLGGAIVLCTPPLLTLLFSKK